uniref:CAAX prenyl protease n=1 Tax=Leptocylindrus danicus TaxID=163516 RepID=A0A7S2KZA2_9STRA|mmetsp:Transcript_29284/g.42999  ORF Transcript_29284/g.42999 Transcript_29284/m.42999 type:complete len:496 (+) Transcript_29284:46-1533(+)
MTQIAGAGCPVSLSNMIAFLKTFLDENGNVSPLYKQEGASTPDAESIYAPALTYTLLFTLVVYAFEAHLDDLQYAAYKIKDFPKNLKDTVLKIDGLANAKSEGNTKEEEAADDVLLLPKLESKFEKSQKYGVDKIRFQMVSQLYNLIEGVGFLVCGFLPYTWDMAASVYDKGEIGTSLVFLAILTLIGTITSLPFELYSTFQIEKKHGFNKQTMGLFFSDKVKSLLLTFVIGGPFVALLLKIIEKGGDQFYIYVWFFMVCFSVFMMTIVPVFIMPLFNKYEALEDGDLKDRIYALAGRLNYPLTKLFVMDGSKRSSHSNAFMFGFGKNKRIVLFDTLLKQVHDDEILAILGHELGHWKLGHTLQSFFVTQLYTGSAFYVFSLCFNSHELYNAFGFDGMRVPTIIALLLFFQTLWAPVDKVLSFLLTVNSRKNEFDADKFGAELGMSKDLQTGLIKITLENLGSMCPARLYSIYHYSHPPLVERLSALMLVEKKSD